MWYRYSQNIQAIKNILQNLGASQDIIDYTTSQSQKNKITKIISIVQQNPFITLDELINALTQETQKTKSRSGGILKRYYSVIQKYVEYPSYQKWIQKQISKAEKSNRQINPEVFDYIFEWYNSMLKENKNFDISSYDLQKAIEMADEWNKTIAGRGSGIIYTPLARDKYGNIIDDRVVYKFGNGWYMVELDNKNDLSAEGNKMKHCAGSYWYGVQQGDSKMFSLRDPNNNPHATIELDRNNNIVQAQGKSNTKLSNKLQQMVNEWYLNYKNKEIYYNSNNVDISELRNPHAALEAVKFNNDLFVYVPNNLSNYEKIASIAISNNPDLLLHIPNNLPYYYKLAIIAILKKPELISYIPINTNNYFDIAKAAVSINGEVIKYIPTNINGYEEIAKYAVQKNGMALCYIPETTNEFYNIAKIAIQRKPGALKYISYNNKYFADLALLAANKNGMVMSLVPTNTENYTAIAFAAVKQNGLALQYIPHSIDNYEKIAIEAVKHDASALKYVYKNIPNYEDILKLAIEQNPFTIKDISPSDTSEYPELALYAITKSPIILQYISYETPNYAQISKKAISLSAKAIKYVPTHIPEYYDLATYAAKRDPQSLLYIPNDIPNYNDIVNVAIENNGEEAYNYIPKSYWNTQSTSNTPLYLLDHNNN